MTICMSHGLPLMPDLRILLILEMALILDLSRILPRTKIDFLLKKRSFRTMIRSCARRWMTQLGV